MSLQDIFYLSGIVFMTLSILILLTLVVLAIYIKKKTDALRVLVGDSWEEVHASLIQPIKRAVHMGNTILPILTWLHMRNKKKK